MGFLAPIDSSLGRHLGAQLTRDGQKGSSLLVRVNWGLLHYIAELDTCTHDYRRDEVFYQYDIIDLILYIEVCFLYEAS